MYLDDYKRWMEADLEDAALKTELESIEGNDEEIKDRFAVSLAFGTAGLRGVLGAGTNRMNIYVVRQATQGLANWVKTQGGNQLVAISYDSRINSDVFAKTAACVLAANGIKVRIYDALMPVPALSFATRYYEANAGVMVTASHNPAKYNGYKAYGPDGCQMTDEAADIVYAEIQKTDILTGAKMMSFEEVQELISRNIIEVAPLAFMRGRTLNNAFIILDEAQNTTAEQMLMFLTRMGFGSRCVITGDPSQSDLNRGEYPGLQRAVNSLRQLPEIGFVFFDTGDVVRHALLEKIIRAYQQEKKLEEPVC